GHFADWVGDPPTRPDVDARPRSRERTVHVVHREGSVQSEIRIGHPGAPKTTPDYFPLLVANTVLGGAFTSRLNLNLREEHGFTYGVRSRFSFRRGAGPFSVSAAVGTDVTADAVREVVNELEGLVEDGPTEEETRAARDYIAGVFPLRLETTGQVAARVAELVVYGLPDDWHATYRDRVRAVEADSATEAVRRHIRPGEAQIVVVGDADAVTAPLEALGLGTVIIHEGEG
ncbi:MAG TPA: insulinase family protein, partial [Longimicrobiales bacterium]|nr:insulinase family protein [Longimicrobiales bacterium]